MIKRSVWAAALLGLTSLTGTAAAQVSDVEVPQIVIETGDVSAGGESGDEALDLANIVQSAAKNVTTVQEAPAIVTVITASDMAAAGARNLQDVLQMVPGISYGIDVFNVTGLVFRGTWAYEGKILFLVDDIPVNDLLYGIYAMPPNFPVALLQRVDLPVQYRYRLAGVGLSNFKDPDETAPDPGLFD